MKFKLFEEFITESLQSSILKELVSKFKWNYFAKDTINKIFYDKKEEIEVSIRHRKGDDYCIVVLKSSSGDILHSDELDIDFMSASELDKEIKDLI